MCGIVGYAGDLRAASILLDGPPDGKTVLSVINEDDLEKLFK